jgi:hypothetical protein
MVKTVLDARASRFDAVVAVRIEKTDEPIGGA